MPKSLLRICAFTLGLGQLWSGAAYADPSVSAYLVARHADRQNDFETAAEYYLEALFFDPDNTLLAQGAIDALMAFGDFEKAAEVAETLPRPERANSTSNIALIGDAAIESDYQRIVTLLEQDGVLINTLMDNLILGWAQVGLGNLDVGYAAFDRVIGDDRYKAIGLNHLGLAKAFVGDTQGALDAFAAIAVGNFQTARTVLAEAQILASIDRRAEASRKLREAFGISPLPKSLGKAERRQWGGSSWSVAVELQRPS